MKHGSTQSKQLIIFNCQDVNYVIKIMKKKGEGVVIYITNCINSKIIDNLTLAENKVHESISVELYIANSKPIIVSCLYRQPDSKISQSIDITENLPKNVKCH